MTQQRWVPMFSRAWLAERRHDDNELEWLTAGMHEVWEKGMDSASEAHGKSMWFGFWNGLVVGGGLVWLLS